MKLTLSTFLTLIASAISVVHLPAGELSATREGDTIVVESKGGALTYRAIVDSKQGGNITQVSLPAKDAIIARDLNDIFFHGMHGTQYTLRGWTGKSKFILSSSIALASQKPDEIVVQVNTMTTGTFKVLEPDEALKAQLRKTLVGYKDKTFQVKRTYTFKPDRIVMHDELQWVYPDMDITRVDVTPAFMPRTVQGPARMTSGPTKASFYSVGSGGDKLPHGITYPFTVDNFLKNGYKVSLRTTETSFSLPLSDRYFYEKAWQQDWYQLSGFIYNLTGYPAGKTITINNEVLFSKATVAEMPPLVTLRSPAWDAHWLDEKDEVPKYKIGDRVNLSVAAINSDGSSIPDQDISWEIHIDPWWNTPPVTLGGATTSYVLPAVKNEEDRVKSKDRALLAVIKVTVKGKNGTESVEPFAMLVGR